MSKTYGKHNLTSDQIVDILESITLDDTVVGGGGLGLRVAYEGHAITKRYPADELIARRNMELGQHVPGNLMNVFVEEKQR